MGSRPSTTEHAPASIHGYSKFNLATREQQHHLLASQKTKYECTSMREQHLTASSSHGEIRISVTSEALASLQKGAIFQDGPSLVRFYRSVIVEIAFEKISNGATEPDGTVRILAYDLE